jgi:HEAT repeat protein
LVGRALAVARVAGESDDSDEYGRLLWQAGADGAGSLPVGLQLLGSDDPDERAAGCALLGHASDQNEAVRAETVAALVRLAQRETEACVLCSLACAIERTCDERAVPVLVALAGHPDAEVRLSVATSFAGVVTGLPDGPDVRALIALTRDRDPQVRNWATFTLGFQAEVDSPAIRAALWERTGDENADAREEGIHGLARRHDPRSVPLLTQLLDNPDGAHVLTFRAAQIMGAPELLPALLEYEPDGAGVTAAVNACDPEQQARLDACAWDLVCALHRLRPDLDAAVYRERFDFGLTLGIDAGRGLEVDSVEALLKRADGDPARAAGLVVSDLPKRA